MVTSKFKSRLLSLSSYTILSVVIIHILFIPVLYQSMTGAYRESIYEQFISQSRSVSGLLADAISTKQIERDSKYIHHILDSALLGGDIVYIEVRHKYGTITATDNAASKPRKFIEDESVGENNDNTYFITVPVYFSEKEDLSVLNIGFDETLVEEKYDQMRLRIKYIIAVYLAFIILFFALSVRIIHRPLHILRKRSQDVVNGDTGTPLRISSGISEINDLASDLDMMRIALVEMAYDMEHKAMHDKLTGLPNRYLFSERLETEVIDARSNKGIFSVLLLDLDRFKEVNDILGHGIGDDLLIAISSRMSSAIRDTDILARIGGDEFCILLHGAGQILAERIADKLLKMINEPVDIKGHSLKVAASIGISVFPDNGNDSELLLQRADVAMYYAKNTRLRIASYHEDMDSDSHANMIMSHDLKDAINSGQFRAVFQPKVSLQTGQISGMELLLRWQHPILGLLNPDQFIPLAERDNIIGELTRWSIRKYLPKLMELTCSHKEFHLSVNVSPNDLLDSYLYKEIADIANNVSCPMTNLYIEVTENTIMKNPERSVDILNKFHHAGIGVSVDDFGTGYSSLAYLQKFPISELKIDKSFIHNLDRNSTNFPIVSATITMAHDLGITVVAEGVENEDEINLLKEMGCDFAQGFYYSEPIELEDLMEYVKVSEENEQCSTR